jgi:hypothetical protein
MPAANWRKFLEVAGYKEDWENDTTIVPTITKDIVEANYEALKFTV